jgi:sugar phosphate permease
MDTNGSSSAFTSMLASTTGASFASPNVNYVIEAVATTSAWTWLFTVLAACVVYDQSMFLPRDIPLTWDALSFYPV